MCVSTGTGNDCQALVQDLLKKTEANKPRCVPMPAPFPRRRGTPPAPAAPLQPPLDPLQTPSSSPSRPSADPLLTPSGPL